MDITTKKHTLTSLCEGCGREIYSYFKSKVVDVTAHRIFFVMCSVSEFAISGNSVGAGMY